MFKLVDAMRVKISNSKMAKERETLIKMFLSASDNSTKGHKR